MSAKALVNEVGVMTCEAPRAPWPAMHPDVRKGLIEAAKPLDPLVLCWGR